MKKRLAHIFIAILICLIIGFLSSLTVRRYIDTWYSMVNKPEFMPQNWVFAPIWSILYILMGVSAGMVWSRGIYHKWVKTAMYHFVFQLILNATWPLIFFGLQRPFWALIAIIALLVLLILTIKWFYIVNRIAAYLLIPYLIWILYATFLTYQIWQLN